MLPLKVNKTADTLFSDLFYAFHTKNLTISLLMLFEKCNAHVCLYGLFISCNTHMLYVLFK